VATFKTNHTARALFKLHQNQFINRCRKVVTSTSTAYQTQLVVGGWKVNKHGLIVCGFSWVWYKQETTRNDL